MIQKFIINQNKYKFEQGHEYQGADYVMRAKVGDEWKDIGAGVKKEDKFKRAYLSFTLDEGFYIEGSKITLNEKDKPEERGITPDDIENW